MIGSAYGVSSPVKTFFNTLYVEAHLQAGQRLVLPEGAEERALYIAAGAVSVATGAVNGEPIDIPQHTMAVLANRPGLSITANEESRIAIVGGEKISQRYLYWNFVSSREARIEQAKQDWRNWRFAKVPGDEEEFIPLPD